MEVIDMLPRNQIVFNNSERQRSISFFHVLTQYMSVFICPNLKKAMVSEPKTSIGCWKLIPILKLLLRLMLVLPPMKLSTMPN